MVNLMLIGKACSNVFDGVIELDSGGESKSILKGILKRSEIGFLSLFEHYNSCEVGENMKSPLFPIWVVCSESHFTVLFSLNKSIVKNESIQQFDLYYYDGLAGQDDEIQLSIALNRKYQYDDLIPPLDHCIRTKWKGACIDWNGYEPML
ncbi:FAM188B (predicted) [Pycnogonum litorale]